MAEFEANIWQAVLRVAFGGDVKAALADLKTYWFRVRGSVMADEWVRNWWQNPGRKSFVSSLHGVI